MTATDSSDAKNRVKQAQRTPGPLKLSGKPWQIKFDCWQQAITNSKYGFGVNVAGITSEESAAVAEYIVRACNAHDDLVAALRSVMAVTDGYKQEGTAWDAARAALAKAGEGA